MPKNPSQPPNSTKPSKPPKVAPNLLGAIEFMEWKISEDIRISEEERGKGKGTSGLEDWFALDTARALAGLPPVAPMLMTAADGVQHLISGMGSGNIPLLTLFVRTAASIDPSRCRMLWRQVFDHYAKTAWMGSEVGSRIYWQWHLIPIAGLVWHLESKGYPLPGDRELAEQARQWLRQWWLWLYLSRDPKTGRVLFLGMRSGGHVPHPGLLEICYSVGMGLNEEQRWLSAAQGTGQGLKTQWELYAIQGPLRSVLKSTAEPLAAVEGRGPLSAILATGPGWPVASPFHFAYLEKGHAVWCEENVNPNTTAVLAGIVDGTEVSWLPEDGGDHVRGKKVGKERATCTREGGELVYESNLQSEPHQRAALPVGRELWHVSWDGKGPRILQSGGD